MPRTRKNTWNCSRLGICKQAGYVRCWNHLRTRRSQTGNSQIACPPAQLVRHQYRRARLGLQRRVAIELGADLTPVWSKFAQWLLSDEDYGLCKIAWKITDAEAVRKVSALYHQADATLQDWQKLVSSLPETHSEGEDYIRKAAIEFAYIGWALAVGKVEATESSVGYALDQAANHSTTACELTAAAFQAKEEAMLIQAAKLVEIIDSIPGRAPLASAKRASDQLPQPGKDFPNSRQ